MMLIPAVDLKQGRCVRLYQGKYDEETHYSSDPVQVAEKFQERGAKRIHVVDLDGAFTGSGTGYGIIESICSTVNIPIEVGGGIRTVETAVGLLEKGVAEVILGTVVLENQVASHEIISGCGPDRVQIGFDFRNDMLAVRGWEKLVSGNVVDEIKKWQDSGIQRFILTDVLRDGTLSGPNIDAYTNIAQSTDVKITAAGGISSAEDIKALLPLEENGLDRVISGKAIYENTIRLEDFI